jgi:sugar lactone lactonase YvrE
MAHGAIQTPSGYEAEALDQNFAGGFDYLPNGDIIGMYVDTTGAVNSYIGVIDANGDGIPADVEKKYDFGGNIWGAFVKVSPDGSFALFGESSTYKVRRMDLESYAVTELNPVSGSFDGAYDLAFIDSAHCYLSANPAFGTTNKIYHLDVAALSLTEVATVDNTYSGGIDVDDEGNLYYLRNTDEWPIPDTGAFTLLEFGHTELEYALAHGTVLTPAEAQQIAVLDGGIDVAWHSSGYLYVSDNHHGEIYRISPLTGFATLSSDIAGGFSTLAIYKREQPFAPDTWTPAKLAAAYADEFGGPTPANIYQIAPIMPAVGIVANAASFGAGDRFVLSVAVQPIAQPFDAYVVFKGPGVVYSLTPSGLVEGIGAYVAGVPGLKQAVTKDILDLSVPSGIPTGTWTIYAGLMPEGTAPSPPKALALDSIEVTVE